MSGRGDLIPDLTADAVTSLVILVAVTLSDGTGIRHGRQGGRCELVGKIISKGEQPRRIATKLALPGGDAPIRAVGVIEFAQDAGWDGSVGEMGNGLEAVVTSGWKVGEVNYERQK
jgi:hypothetical protein